MGSFDPFDLSDNGESAIVDKPALYLGFDFTSCSVTMEKSAQMAYDLTNNERKVFVRIHHAGGTWPQYYHCIHVDGGCSFVCSRNEPTPPEFFVDLSTIVDQFVQDAFASTWAPTVINYTPTCTMEIDMIHEGSTTPHLPLPSHAEDTYRVFDLACGHATHFCAPLEPRMPQVLLTTTQHLPLGADKGPWPFLMGIVRCIAAERIHQGRPAPCSSNCGGIASPLSASILF